MDERNTQESSRGLGSGISLAGESAAVIFSLATNGSQNDPANIKKHFSALEAAQCSGVTLMLADEVNVHIPPYYLIIPDSAKRVRVFETLTVNFLIHNVELILRLKIPFNIILFFQLKYQGLENTPIHELFVKPKNDTPEAWLAAINQTKENIGRWAEDIKARLKSDNLVEKVRSLKARKVMGQLYANGTNLYKYTQSTDLLAKVKMKDNQELTKSVCVAYINAEAACSLLLAKLNKDSLDRSGRKKFDCVVYTGGRPNKPLEVVRTNMVSEEYRWQQLMLDKDVNLVDINFQRTLADLQKKVRQPAGMDKGSELSSAGPSTNTTPKGSPDSTPDGSEEAVSPGASPPDRQPSPAALAAKEQAKEDDAKADQKMEGGAVAVTTPVSQDGSAVNENSVGVHMLEDEDSTAEDKQIKLAAEQQRQQKGQVTTDASLMGKMGMHKSASTGAPPATVPVNGPKGQKNSADIDEEDELAREIAAGVRGVFKARPGAYSLAEKVAIHLSQDPHSSPRRIPGPGGRGK